MGTEMYSECHSHKLADLCDSIDYGYTASAVNATVGPRFLRITDIVSGHINWREVPSCEVTPDGHKKYRLNDGDIVIARTGATTGVSAYIKEPPDALFASYLVRLRINSTKADSRYISYFLKSSDFWDYMRGVLGDKSAQPNASAKTMTQVKLRLPSLPEQKVIASILGALDDKIELNRQMNETLEAMARAVFKSWFVDFEPIPGLGPRREWLSSPLGRIPKGWGVTPFSDTVEIFGGGTPKTSVPEYWGGDIPWFAVGDAPKWSDVYVIDTEKKITKAGVENSATRILPIGTTIITARGTVGKLALTGVPMAMNQTCYGLRGRIENSSAYTYFSTLNLVTTLQKRTHGSVFDTITRDTLASVKVVSPPSKLIERFECDVAPLMRQILNNLWQSRTLASIRDALLPKLISGELRVPDAERFAV